MPEMEWLFKPQTLAEGVHVARDVLPAGVEGVAVHVINATQSPFTVDAGHEVGHANMAADVSRSAVAELPAGGDLYTPDIKSQLLEHNEDECEKPSSQSPLSPSWGEYSQLLPDV